MKADDVVKAKLEMFGINDLKKDTTVIDQPAVWSDTYAPFNVKTIELNDLDEIKRHIGNCNNLVAKGVLKESANMDLAATITEVTSENVHTVANAYIYGNSEKLQHLKGQIEKVICPVTVHVAEANDYIISSEIVIEPGDPKQLVADTLTFDKDGKITCYGVLGISVNKLVNAKTK